MPDEQADCGREVAREFFYDRFASEFDAKMNRYDLEVRLRIVFDQLLPADISGKRLLDAGCGTGFFSEKACSRGAVVTSMDVGHRLLEHVALKCHSARVVGSVIETGFREESFDLVVCSEVIEHTRDPYLAVKELYRVLKPGGMLALTVPNWTWKWSCILANTLKLRPYEGLENWVGYATLRRRLEQQGFKIIKFFGFHLFPFQLKWSQPLLRKLDRLGRLIGPLYINIGVACRK